MAEICTIKVGIVQSAKYLQSNQSTKETDNHADTTVLGSNYLPIHDFGISVDVSGWEAVSWSVECPTISGDIAYDHLTSEKVYMLVYHQAVHFPKLTIT